MTISFQRLIQTHSLNLSFPLSFILWYWIIAYDWYDYHKWCVLYTHTRARAQREEKKIIKGKYNKIIPFNSCSLNFIDSTFLLCLIETIFFFTNLLALPSLFDHCHSICISKSCVRKSTTDKKSVKAIRIILVLPSVVLINGESLLCANETFA